MPPTNLQQVVLTSVNPDLQMYALLGPTNPIVSGGYGGWETVDRPHRVALTNWAGRKPFQLVLDLLISEFKADTSIEHQIRTIERMSRPNDDLVPRRPPTIRVHGDAIPHTNLPWVINDIAWGPTLRSLDKGYRVRQALTVTLLQKITGNLVNETSVGPGHGHQPKYRTYTVKRGDTLQGIASRLLGDKRRWQQIARLNNIHDPRNLRVGRKLRIPRS